MTSLAGIDDEETSIGRDEFLRAFRAKPDEDALWEIIERYQGRKFMTMKGLEFTYEIKRTRSGEAGGEILFSRKEKTVTRSTVNKAFAKAQELGGGSLPAYVAGPKKLGVFGASYIYPLFIEFGVCRGSRKQ